MVARGRLDKVRARMRRLAAAALLALPALLAFGRGGYFAVTRVRVAILACLLLAVAAVVAERPLPRSTPRPARARRARRADRVDRALDRCGRRSAGPAFADLERLILYTAALGGRDRAAARHALGRAGAARDDRRRGRLRALGATRCRGSSTLAEPARARATGSRTR